MTDASVGAAVVLAFVAAAFFCCAYFIRVRGALWLIAGYDPQRVRDGAGLGRWIGGGCFWLGCATLILAMAEYAAPGGMVGWLFPATILAGTLTMVRGARRFRV
jgi:hypothetical protein